MIAGNYDEGVGLNSGDCGCAYQTDEDQERGDQSIGFTNEIIVEEHRRWLRNLPRHIRLQLGPKANHYILLVHGSPRRINEYLFEDHREDSSWRSMPRRIDLEETCNKFALNTMWKLSLEPWRCLHFPMRLPICCEMVERKS